MINPRPRRQKTAQQKAFEAGQKKRVRQQYFPNPSDPEDRLNYEATVGAESDGTEDIPTKPGIYTEPIYGPDQYQSWLRRFSDHRRGGKLLNVDKIPTSKWDFCYVTFQVVEDQRQEYAAVGRRMIEKHVQEYGYEP